MGNEFPKLLLTDEAKITAQSYLVLNVYRYYIGFFFQIYTKVVHFLACKIRSRSFWGTDKREGCLKQREKCVKRYRDMKYIPSCFKIGRQQQNIRRRADIWELGINH
jgi:hypothetical protein